MIQTTEMIPHSTAANMAEAFVDATAMIAEAKRLVEAAKSRMAEAFQTNEQSRRHDTFDATIRVGNYSDDTEDVIGAWKLAAWRSLVHRLGVLKTMSSKRRAEFDKVCGYGNQRVTERASEMPDITVDTIYSVLMGFCSSAEEFLEEAIVEEYDFWKCHSINQELKTNQKNRFKLDRKVIKPYMVSDSGRYGFRCDYDREKHVIALDNIFHLLDGKGCVSTGTRGPLVDAISASDGSGETEYFRFKCFKNRNLHLEFKRQDLLARFNTICGRNRLGSETVGV